MQTNVFTENMDDLPSGLNMFKLKTTSDFKRIILIRAFGNQTSLGQFDG